MINIPEKWQEELDKEFPKIKDRFWRTGESQPIHCACNGGWYELLRSAFTELSNLPVDLIQFDQIKEKFGGLRLYVHTSNLPPELVESIEDICAKYERASLHVCEFCGSKDPDVELYTGGWLHTMCPKCAAEKGRTKTLRQKEKEDGCDLDSPFLLSRQITGE